MTLKIFPKIPILTVTYLQQNQGYPGLRNLFTPLMYLWDASCPYTNIIIHSRKIFSSLWHIYCRIQQILHWLQTLSQLLTKLLKWSIEWYKFVPRQSLTASLKISLLPQSSSYPETFANHWMFFKCYCPSPYSQAIPFFLGLKKQGVWRHAPPTYILTVPHGSLEMSYIALIWALW